MKPISLLFYIEPVCFRDNPLLLSPWIDWIAMIIGQQPQNSLRLGFASSPWLCRALADRLGTGACCFYPASPRALLAPFKYERHVYAQDLFGDAEEQSKNLALLNLLDEISNKFDPDLIVSFTQNRYIEQVFANKKMLFWELGPLPRLGGKAYAFASGEINIL